MEYMVGKAAKRLRTLRERANMSMQDMADALGMKKTTYQHYEAGFKKDYFNPDKVEQFRAALLERGIPDQDIDLLGYRAVDQARKAHPVATLADDTELSALFAETPSLDAECVTRAALQVLAAIRQHNIDWEPEEVAKAITENAADYTREKQEARPRVISIGGRSIPLPRNPR